MIDYANFTPISSLIGGFLIGGSIILFLISNGRLVGVSGIANNLLTKKENRFDNLLFILGLIIGPIAYMVIFNIDPPFVMTSSIPVIIIGGLLVGIGTKISNGCTSGHGVSGISRFSIRSIIATILFVFSAILTMSIMNVIGIN